jgi:hypothetical protein
MSIVSCEFGLKILREGHKKLIGTKYRYYEGGVSSVYLWNLDDGFAGVVLLKKCKSTASCPQRMKAY